MKTKRRPHYEPITKTDQSFLNSESPLHFLYAVVKEAPDIRKIFVQGLLPFPENISRVSRPGDMDRPPGAQEELQDSTSRVKPSF